MQKQEQPIVNGAPSFWVANDRVEVYISEQGGQIAPLSCKLKHRWATPTATAPWEPAECEETTAPWLQNLRGSFFCLPFEENKKTPYPHGDCANEKWMLVKRTIVSLTLQMDMPHLAGARITKHLSLKEGHRALYQEHIVEGLSGKYPVGVNTLLDLTDSGQGLLSFAKPAHSFVAPEPYDDPANGHYAYLKPGADITDLSKAPTKCSAATDLLTFPNREGFDDCIWLENGMTDALGWSGIVMDGYLFLQLKNNAQLPATRVQFYHGGRHRQPWGGTFKHRLAISEVNASPYQKRSGTSFSKATPQSIRLIQAIHPVPKSFGRIATVSPDAAKQQLLVCDEAGNDVTVPLDCSFLLD